MPSHNHKWQHLQSQGRASEVPCKANWGGSQRCELTPLTAFIVVALAIDMEQGGAALHKLVILDLTPSVKRRGCPAPII
eukprot:2915546-Amphidinium_carterae.1